MKLTNFDNPVMSSWFDLKGARLDSKPYLSGALEARILLKSYVRKSNLFTKLRLEYIMRVVKDVNTSITLSMEFRFLVVPIF